MILYPAIDLKDGKCVRLLRGDMKKATVFSSEPAKQAKSFESNGVEWIHVVDLNGAFEGEPVNRDAVRSILKSVKIPIQLGGGIRDMNIIETWIEEGVSRVILGTAALVNPELVIDACKKFPGKIAVGIDAKNGMVATEGWAKQSRMPDTEMALRFENAGVSHIIYTNIDRDGAMEGLDIEGTRALARKISTPVIASGGISSIADLKLIKMIEEYGVSGVISGRAIYDGKIKIKEALEVLK